jgi:hypothetical protein
MGKRMIEDRVGQASLVVGSCQTQKRWGTSSKIEHGRPFHRLILSSIAFHGSAPERRA